MIILSGFTVSCAINAKPHESSDFVDRHGNAIVGDELKEVFALLNIPSGHAVTRDSISTSCCFSERPVNKKSKIDSSK